MKVRMNGRVELRERIFRRGEIVEITDEEYNARPDCFSPVKDEEVAGKPVVAPPAPLTKAQLQAKLDQLGVPYKPRDTVEQLQSRLSEVIDAHPLSTQNAE